MLERPVSTQATTAMTTLTTNNMSMLRWSPCLVVVPRLQCTSLGLAGGSTSAPYSASSCWQYCSVPEGVSPHPPADCSKTDRHVPAAGEDQEPRWCVGCPRLTHLAAGREQDHSHSTHQMLPTWMWPSKSKVSFIERVSMPQRFQPKFITVNFVSDTLNKNINASFKVMVPCFMS